MINAYAKEQRKPLFEATENFFYVTLPNLNYKLDAQINELDLSILRIVYYHPGIKVPAIHSKLLINDPSVTLNQIRNSIKRKIASHIEYRGSRKTGGYYFRN